MTAMAKTLRRANIPTFFFVVLTPCLWAADCNRNDVEDSGDIATGTSRDCNANDIPDECDVAALRMAYAEPRRFPTRDISSEWPDITSTGDYDGDGDVDLLIAHGAPSSDETTGVVLLRNGGDGTFAPPEVVFTGRWLTSMASGDFDGDGHLDLVLSSAHWQEGPVQVFINRGDGTFESGVPVLFDRPVWRLVAADFNDDGDVDIAGTDSASAFVLFNEGDLDFRLSGEQLGKETLSDNLPLIAADIDSSGGIDLLVPDSVFRTYWLFSFDGDDVLPEPSVLSLGVYSYPLVPGDFDGDGVSDLATRRDLLRGFGGGFFGLPVELGSDTDSVYAAADLDTDGDLDLLVRAADRSIGLLLNDGTGSFSRLLELPLADFPGWLGGQDLDGDGDVDLLAVFQSRSEVSVHLRLEAGVPEHPDVDGNGIPDGCEPDCNRNGVPDGFDITRGASSDCNQNGSPDECDVVTQFAFDPPVEYLSDVSPGSVEALDFDGDQDPDLAVNVHRFAQVTVNTGNGVSIFHPGAIRLLENDGDGTFREKSELDLGEVSPSWLVAADLDGDGDEDLATTSFPHYTIFVLLNDGFGDFSAMHSFYGGQHARELLAVDVDTDGDLDLLAGKSVNGSPEVCFFANAGDATFAPGRTWTDIGTALIATDVDGDGDPDLVADVAGDAILAGVPVIHLNDGAGGFSRRELPGGRVFAAADLDGDGDVDLVGRGAHRNDGQILWNDGSGAFEAEPLPNNPLGSTAADLDGDGDIDLIGTGGIPFGAVLVRNDGPGRDWFVDSLPEVDVSFDTVVADWDGDGRVDLAIPGASRNRFSVFLNRTPPSPSRDENRDGVPDECASAAVRFLRGDCTTDGTVNLTDAICILGRLFAGEEARCATALNANGDLEVNLTDAVFVLGFLFESGAAPVEPFPDCGPGTLPGDAELGCEDPPDCR